MLIRKEVIRKRLEAKLVKLDEAQAAYRVEWAKFHKELVKFYERYVEVVRKADTCEKYHAIQDTRPAEPYQAGRGYHADEVRRIKRNLAILEALEGETIEVEKLHTGKNFTIESMFEDDIA